MKLLIALLLLLASCANNPQLEVLAENLEVPWAIAFLPDDSFLFTERNTGDIYHYENGNARKIGSVSSSWITEGGLLGIAVDPEFEKNNHVYLYYTYKGGNKTLNRVSRFVYEDVLKDEEILIDAIPGALYHDGGRLEFGPDSKLYITTGDATEPSLAQDLSSLAGKILRINTDGSIPEDNPYNSSVYSYGHRNPQGLAWYKGMMIAPEHGPDRNDEINVIVPGGNYGWPAVQCANHEGYNAPIRCFSDWTLAPAGATFDDKGNLYVAGLRGTQIRKFYIQDKEITREEVLLENIGRLREVKYHDGYLYMTTSNTDGRGIPRLGDDKMLRIKV